MFLTPFSVLLPSRRAISAHLFPSSLCASTNFRSSSSDQTLFLFRDELILLSQRSRHCFPLRPRPMHSATLAHCPSPKFSTAATSSTSSCRDHICCLEVFLIFFLPSGEPLRDRFLLPPPSLSEEPSSLQSSTRLT